MTPNYSKILTDLNGIGFSDAQGNPLTLGAAVILAASVNLPGDDALGPLDKFRVGEMGMCAFRGLPMSDAQIAVAKDRIGKAYNNPMMVFMAFEALDGIDVGVAVAQDIQAGAPIIPLVPAPPAGPAVTPTAAPVEVTVEPTPANV